MIIKWKKKIKEIKQIFIDIIHIFQQHQLIEQHLLLLSSRSSVINFISTYFNTDFCMG